MSLSVVTPDDIGRNGLEENDLGKFAVVCPITRVVYLRDTEEEARDLLRVMLFED